MANTNSLVDIACPECGQEDIFGIQVTSFAIVTDDGVEEYHNAEWGGDSFIICQVCKHQGTVEQFQNDQQEEEVQA